MGLLNKIKSALFEEEVSEENQQIAKKIDVEKTIKEEDNEIKVKHYEEDSFSVPFTEPKEEKPVSPIIFDVEDFVEEQEPYQEEYKKPLKKEEQKIIYGGYVEKEIKETEKVKFKPSPVISPVYGVLDKNYVPDNNVTYHTETRKSLDTLFAEEHKKPLDLDEVRQKAFGETKNVPIVKEEKEEDLSEEKDDSLLYEMEDINDKPGIEKISLGDAEEYFEDLGLEYDVDYKDLSKEKMTRAKKNKELSDEVEEEIKEDKKIEEETSNVSTDEDETEEKNLYDLIDMMYDSKE